MIFRADEIAAIVEEGNAEEVARRREYWEYLMAKGGETDTFEEHLRRYGMIVRTGETATDSEMGELEQLIGRPLPTELKEFYTTLGMLVGLARTGRIEVPSVRSLLKRLRDHEVRRYEKLHSLGLADMMRAAWGNDRWELEAEGGILTAGQLAAINGTYVCIGWICNDPGEEGHTYITFDRAGAFDTIFYHQDAADDLQEELLGMIERSPATGTATLSSILARLLEPEIPEV